jgi:hypothetical protein
LLLSMQLVRLVLALWLIVAGFAGSMDLCGPAGELDERSAFTSVEAIDADAGCEDEHCTDCFDGCLDCACCALRQPVVVTSFALAFSEPTAIQAVTHAAGVALTGSARDVFLPPRA